MNNEIILGNMNGEKNTALNFTREEAGPALKTPRHRNLFLLVVIIMLFASTFVYWSIQRDSGGELFISNVPYRGLYTYPATYERSAEAATAMLLVYYAGGSTDFETGKPLEALGDTRLYFKIKKRNYTLHDIRDFFTVRDFETSIVGYTKPNDVRALLNKGVPVVIRLKLIPEEDPSPSAFFVVIGDVPERKAFIAHEFTYGSNFELSYRDVEAWWQSPYQKQFLVVQPSHKKTSFSKNVQHLETLLSERIALMDSLGIRDYFKNSELIYFKEGRHRDFDSRSLLEELVTTDSFQEELVPRERLLSYMRLAGEYLVYGEPEKALELLEKEALPLNQNLNESFVGGWPRAEGVPSQNSRLWRLLGDVYVALGQYENAKAAFSSKAEIDSKTNESSLFGSQETLRIRRLEELSR